MTITTDLTTQELVQYCTNSHDAFVRKAGERLQGAAVMAYELRAERDALQARVEHATTPECVGTIVAGEGYVPACRTLRAERDETRALLREARNYLRDDGTGYTRAILARIDATLKGDAK